jgi:t-SNARE complex subunit (syntaxin)
MMKISEVRDAEISSLTEELKSTKRTIQELQQLLDKIEAMVIPGEGSLIERL